MRERDLNLVPKEEELSRLKGILFPKKSSRLPVRTQAVEKQEEGHGQGGMRSEIQRLRDEINCMMEKGRARETHSMETERAYLDGINRLSRGLKNYSSEISEVFEEFMGHLPTNALARKNYSNDYYLSMFIQHAIWSRMDAVLRRPIVTAFQAVRTAAMLQREEQEGRQVVQLERAVKFKNRVFSSLGKYFSSWRYNSMCMGVRLKSEDFLKENNLEYDRKIEQNLLNFPLLVLMLEELGRESADMSELLVMDEKKVRVCKYMEDGTSLINSNIETVTQRSLFQGSDNPHQTYTRFEFNIGPSLTHLAVERGEILFVTNLSKHPDYSEIDNLCFWQSQGKSSSNCLKGGAIFYPLFNSQHECIAIFRQYFYDGSVKVVSNGKIQKMCMFLQLGASLQRRMRAISREKEYQREGYYLKMISMIKRVETAKGNEQEAMSVLESELRDKLAVSSLAIYKVERRESEGRKDILLQSVYGDSQECGSLLAMVDQLMKQQSNHVYLTNRLLIYSKMMLFDLHLDRQEPSMESSSRNSEKQLLPVELIVNSMSKIQTVLSHKELETRVRIEKEMQSEARKRQQALKELQKSFREKSLELLAMKTHSNDIVAALSLYFKEVWSSINQMAHTEKQQYIAPQFYLECCLGKSRKESRIVKIDASCMQISENERSLWYARSSNMMKIDLSDSSWLVIDYTLQKQGEHLKSMVQSIVQQFIQSYFRLQEAKRAVEWQPNMFTMDMQTKSAIQPSESKKKWQLAHCCKIYQHFNKAVLSFMSSLLNCQDQPIWQKQHPKQSNLQEWKQLIYKSALADTNLSIDIMHKNPILTVAEYNQIKTITNNRISLLDQECWLAIGCSKTLFKMKNMPYDGSLLIKIPKYFCFSNEEAGPNSYEAQVRVGLDKLKAIWLKLCRSLLQANRYFTQNQLLTAAKRINNWFNLSFATNLKFVFKKLNRMSTTKEKGIRSLNEFAACIEGFKKKQIWRALSKIVAFSRERQIERVKVYIDKAKISSISRIATKLIFSKCFKSIVALGRRRISVEAGLLKVENLVEMVGLSTKREYFRQLVYRKRQKTYSELLIEAVRRLYFVKMNSNFNHLMNYSKHVVKYATVNEDTLQLDACRSLSTIRKQINKRVPQFSLYLSIDEKRCFCLHSPQSKSLSIAQTDEIYNPSAPYIVYQSGTQGQLLWNYSFKQGQNCFVIKDKLNYISKCVQAGLRNYKSQMQIKMNILSIFKRAYIRKVKSSNWKKWRQESSRIAMQERNRLNDSLYQISIESQTMREKLKGQEKTLKNNFGSYQELKKKQQQYEESILFCSRQVLQIEESHNKLQNTRTLYNTLHRRAVLKSCLLLWRNHSLILQLKQLKTKRKNHLPFFQIAAKTVFTITSLYSTARLREAFLKMKQARKSIPYKSKEVERLHVTFEDKGTRLITFQSEMGDQQNSNHQSNRSASPQPLQSLDSNQGSRFKLDKLKGEAIPGDLSAEQMARYNNGAYKLNPKTLKFLKRMGKLQS